MFAEKSQQQTKCRTVIPNYSFTKNLLKLTSLSNKRNKPIIIEDNKATIGFEITSNKVTRIKI